MTSRLISGSVAVDGVTSAATASVTVNSPAPVGVEPTGPGIVSVRTLTGSTLTAKLGSVAAGQKVSFPPGQFGDADFNRPSNYPVYSVFEQKAGALLGSGIDQTIIACPAGTSTKASQVPPQGPSTSFPQGTNPFITLRCDGSPTLSGFTLKGFDQGMPYSGIQLYQTTGAQVTDVKVKGIPGTAPANPGETFAIGLQRSVNTTLTRVEVDGTNDAGVKVGASGVGLNFTTGIVHLVSCHLHDMKWGAGVTGYECSGTIVYDDLVSTGNVIPVNFERCAQSATTITLNRPVLKGCTAKTSDGQPVHMIIDSDFGSAKVLITDPQYDGTHFTVVVHPAYWGAAQKQLTTDITLTVGGVPRPDLLRIATGYTTS